MRILIVDDEKVFRRQVKNILIEILPEEPELVEVVSEKEARGRIYDAGMIDFAIVDLYIPQIHPSEPKSLKSGLELIEHIRRHAQRQEASQPPKIIAITQYGEAVPEFDARRAGADDYIEKDTAENMKEKLMNSLTELGIL